MSIIQTKDVKKWFGDFQALKGITMDVAEGEVLVVCGPSGSGKSTFIRCINRLEQHQEGQIIVDGIELTNDLKNIEAIRSCLLYTSPSPRDNTGSRMPSSA